MSDPNDMELPPICDDSDLISMSDSYDSDSTIHGSGIDLMKPKSSPSPDTFESYKSFKPKSSPSPATKVSPQSRASQLCETASTSASTSATIPTDGTLHEDSQPVLGGDIASLITQLKGLELSTEDSQITDTLVQNCDLYISMRDKAMEYLIADNNFEESEKSRVGLTVYKAKTFHMYCVHF